MPKVKIKLPLPLRKYTGGKGQVDVEADTVKAALLALNQYNDTMSDRLLAADQNELRKFIKVYVKGKDVRSFDGLNTSLSEEDSLEIVTAFAGG